MRHKTAYQRMLQERFYLYRPWIPVCKSVEAEIIGNLELKEPVLDIGCGNGLFGKCCYKKKIDVGLDCDEAAVDEAQKRHVYNALEVGDACALPFADGSFNTLISICALEHIPDLGSVLRNAHRVLKKGGRFIFTVPGRQFGRHLVGSRALRFIGLKKKAEDYGDRKNKRSGHIHIYEADEWRRLVEEKGFRVDSADYIFPKEAVFLWSLFHSLPFKIIFLPFRLFRDLNIRLVDNILRTILDRSLSKWIIKRSTISNNNGGYLLIQTSKPG